MSGVTLENLVAGCRDTPSSDVMSCHHEKPARSALDLIGNTALITLARAHPGPGRIVAKAEFLNPGGSICAAAQLARELLSDAVIATVLCDTGLSTPR